MEKNTQYFSNNPKVKSERREFIYQEGSNKFSFIYDNGVFSKGYVDFGSRTLIDAFVPLDAKEPCLDLGCGYGPIGIVLSKKFNKKFYMVDVNERAVSLTNENIVKNKVDAVSFVSNITEDIDSEIKFSQIVTNPPIRAGKQTVFNFYEQAFSRLVTGGELWVVIQKKQGAPSTIKKLESLFGNCSVITKKNGYFILKSVYMPID